MDRAEEKLMMGHEVSKTMAGEISLADRKTKVASVSRNGDLIYDLHIEAIPGGTSVAPNLRWIGVPTAVFPQDYARKPQT